MKIIFAFALFLYSISAYSQIEVREKAKKTTIGKGKNGQYEAELYYFVIDSDTTYSIMYQNMEYTRITDIQSFTFKDIDNTREKLFNIMMSVFDDQNIKNKEYSVPIKLGETNITISNYRIMGVSASMVSVLGKGYFVLPKKQVQKLFGK